MPGTGEIIVIMAVAFLLFGPQKMPEIGRSVGKALRELQKMRDELMNTVNGSLDDEDTDPRRKYDR
ncbi:MAG TPA: twin-arginine translocase TatA/TatE family subunit [Armatimonadota bacterium]